MKFNLIKKLDKKKTKTYFFRIFLLFVIFLIYYFPVKANNNLFLEDNSETYVETTPGFEFGS